MAAARDAVDKENAAKASQDEIDYWQKKADELPPVENNQDDQGLGIMTGPFSVDENQSDDRDGIDDIPDQSEGELPDSVDISQSQSLGVEDDTPLTSSGEDADRASVIPGSSPPPNDQLTTQSCSMTMQAVDHQPQVVGIPPDPTPGVPSAGDIVSITTQNVVPNTEVVQIITLPENPPDVGGPVPAQGSFFKATTGGNKGFIFKKGEVR